MPEMYSEFHNAFSILATTRRFEDQVLAKTKAGPAPVLLVEGVSDQILLATAWTKLYTTQPLPFQIIPCGVQPSPELRSGGAEMLRRCVEFLAIASEKPMIAIFDNDRTGNEQYAALNKDAFDVASDAFHKEHRSGRAHAILLPIPEGRARFVTPHDTEQRYLVIEHYFSDAVLKAHGNIGPAILDTPVFKIIGDKVKFAQSTAGLTPEAFTAFGPLFSRIFTVLGIQQMPQAMDSMSNDATATSHPQIPHPPPPSIAQQTAPADLHLRGGE